MLVITAVMLIACQSEKHYGIPDDSQVVDLYLDEHDLKSIPDDIGKFKEAEILRIRNSRDGKWMIFPPAFSEVGDKPLTSGICGLENVRELDISMQILTSLPDCFVGLKALERLDLRYNFLDIGKEWEKLRQLPNLKMIYLDGNIFSKDSLRRWNKDHPGISFIYDFNKPSTPEEQQAMSAIDAMIYSYYNTMSDRNWEAYREFFWDDATLTTIWQKPGETEPSVHVSTIGEFISGTAEGPDSQPVFEEKPVGINIQIRGDLAVAWVSYEAMFGTEDNLMEWSGTDIFTLIRHKGEWKISSLAYASD